MSPEDSYSSSRGPLVDGSGSSYNQRAGPARRTAVGESEAETSTRPVSGGILRTGMRGGNDANGLGEDHAVLAAAQEHGLALAEIGGAPSSAPAAAPAASRQPQACDMFGYVCHVSHHAATCDLPEISLQFSYDLAATSL